MIKDLLARVGLLLLGGAVAGISFVPAANAQNALQRRTLQLPTDLKFSLRVGRNSFAPLATTQSQAPQNATQGADAVGSQVLLLCSTIEPPNPYASFLLGNDHIYATIGTPIGSSRVSKIDLGSVTFDDGTRMVQTDCSGNLPQPDLTLQNGSTGTSQNAQNIVPQGTPPPPVNIVLPPVQNAQNGAQPIVTPTPIYNPYTTPAPQQGGGPTYIPIPNVRPTP